MFNYLELNYNKNMIILESVEVDRVSFGGGGGEKHFSVAVGNQ